MRDEESRDQRQRIEQLQTTADVAKTEVSKKDRAIAETEHLVEEERRRNKQLQGEKQTLRQERDKANHIIATLQNFVRDLGEKCAMRSEIALRQEEVVVEKESEVGRLRAELGEAKTTAKGIEEELAACKTELDDANKKLKISDTTINYLNTRLTVFEESSKGPFNSALSENLDPTHMTGGSGGSAKTRLRGGVGGFSSDATLHTPLASAYFPQRKSLNL